MQSHFLAECKKVKSDKVTTMASDCGTLNKKRKPDAVRMPLKHVSQITFITHLTKIKTTRLSVNAVVNQERTVIRYMRAQSVYTRNYKEKTLCNYPLRRLAYTCCSLFSSAIFIGPKENNYITKISKEI